jgi:lysophospholipase L1-like esterase
MSCVRALLVCGSLLLAGCGGGDDTPERLRYAVIGDSYSNGEGLTPEQAWPVTLAERLDLDLVLNPAVSGYTSADAIATELEPFRRADADVATLMIGANDAFQGRPLADFRRDLRSLLAGMGDARVVVVTIPDFTRKPAGADSDPAAIPRFNAVIRAEAERAGAPVADVYPVSQVATDPSPDGLHPGAGELDAWVEVIAPVARAAWGR